MATATNKEGTEIRNCEFEFDTQGTQAPQGSPKKKIVQEEKKESLVEKFEDQLNLEQNNS